MALRRYRVSLRLLRTGVPPSPAELVVFEHLVRELQSAGGVFTTTYRGRFADVDPVVNTCLARRHPAEAPLAVHDWAASSALTSVEWAQSLFRALPRATLTASNLMLFLVELTLPTGEVFVVDPAGAALQYVRPPFVIRLQPPEPRIFAINRAIGARATKTFERLGLVIPPAWLESDADELMIDSIVLRKLPIIHPEARLLAAADSRFRVRRHSVFEPLEAPVDAIRTMNIFNRDYFPAERLREGARNVWANLRPGGTWIVGRTFETGRRRNEVTLLGRTERGFEALERIGPGSEIESIALEPLSDRHTP